MQMAASRKACNKVSDITVSAFNSEQGIFFHEHETTSKKQWPGLVKKPTSLAVQSSLQNLGLIFTIWIVYIKENSIVMLRVAYFAVCLGSERPQRYHLDTVILFSLKWKILACDAWVISIDSIVMVVAFGPLIVLLPEWTLNSALSGLQATAHHTCSTIYLFFSCYWSLCMQLL